MKNYYHFLFENIAIVLLTLIYSNASAQTVPTISYQGSLQNNGAAMNGTDTLTIRLYTSETGGSPLYSETQSVNVSNGVFNLAIGSVTPLLPTLDFTKQYYLGVSVDGGAELAPRSMVSFAPYAFRALNADTASYANTATLAKGVSGGVVTSVDGDYGALTLSGDGGITITNDPPNIIISASIGSAGVQSVNSEGGKLTLVGSGGTTIADTGTTITIHSQTFTGGTGIQAVENSDSSITVTNGTGPIATITLGKQNADTGQVLAWNGSAWRPAALSDSLLLDSIKDLRDARDDRSSIYLGAGSGVIDLGQNRNIALGIGAMHSNTLATVNVAIGDSALSSNTTGAGNAALGYYTLHSNTTGGQNVAVGDSAESAAIGGGNTAVGYQAMGTTSGGANTACGIWAMEYGSGYLNSAYGDQALYHGSGENNSAFGVSAMQYYGSGNFNSAFGALALEDSAGEAATGSYNVAVGFGAMNRNDSGSHNTVVGAWTILVPNERSYLVAIGDSSLCLNGRSRTSNAPATLDSATANTGVGAAALVANSTGAYNTATGFHSLYDNSIGYRNTALGYLALNQNVIGNDNTAIGSSAGPTSSDLNNTTTLGSGAYATASNQVVLGNSGVSTLYCQGAYAATTANSANLYVSSSGQIMRSTSSARYKTNIHDLDINTDKLYDLRPVSYTSKIDGKEYFGLVAEDVAKVLPDLAEYARSKDVIPGSTSETLIPDAVKYPMLSVLLLEELKKEHAKSEAQEKINADLERRLEALEAAQKPVR